MKQKNNGIPSLIRNEKCINDSVTIANTFINFTSIAETLQSNFQANPLEVFFNKKTMTLVITPTDEEINKIISSLNINKSCGPNSTPTKILHLAQDQISKYLATICNLSFSTGIILTILKTYKVKTS